MHDQYQHAFRVFESAYVVNGIPTGYGLDNRMIGVIFPAGLRIFLFDIMSRPALGPAQPPIQWVPETLSLGVKRPGREADHSPPTSADVKRGAVPPLPKYVFMT
jgi:hypothetical protein